MLPGFDGHLVSSAWVERQSDAADAQRLEHIRRELAARRQNASVVGPASTPAVLLHTAAAPLTRALGFGPPKAIGIVGRAVAATLIGGRHPVALLVTGWAEPLDSLWRIAVVQALERSAAWCVVFDGLHIRIVDAARLYARRYAEFDLDLALDHPASFAAFWHAANVASLAGSPDDPASLHALVAESDRHAAGVCRSLRDGVLEASAGVLNALAVHGRHEPPRLPPDGFEQSLTIVYRILFLLFAEARALVPVWHPVYRESYSVESLRDLAEQPHGSVGLWDALRAISRLSHAGCQAGDLRVTPFNGRLFAPARTPLAERRNLDDEAARGAVLALSTRPAPDRGGRERIAYRDLGVEQLGAVYETLLDYEPKIEAAGITLESGSGLRKATGTFYTPQPIADYLVRRTLGPLVRDASPDRILQLRIVDPSMGSGAFLVAACRYLSDAYETAVIMRGGCHPSDIGPSERASIRRTVGERCLYGVDLNPMAVQLARLSIWLATLAVDRPLSFLDHRLQVGDSLLGAWLANLRHPPEKARRAHLPLFDENAAAGALRDALPLRLSLESMPNDTLDHVRAKERAFASLTVDTALVSRWKRVADVWCAAWFGAATVPANTFGALTDAILRGGGALPARSTQQDLAAADSIAAARRFFLWELEFPEVFFDIRGARRPDAGFDAVIGNPPWDMIRGDSAIASARTATKEDASLVVRFSRDAGVYHSQSNGHANRYQLFLERAIALTRPGGRLGLVLPSGLATDHGSAPLRRLLLSQCNLDAVVGIDNRRGIFPIHRSVRFLLVTASPGAATERFDCNLGMEDAADLETLGEEDEPGRNSFPVHLSPAILDRISGPCLAIPFLRDATDLAIVERAAALFPPLGGERGWGVSFGRELNATDDRGAFRDAGRGLPVIEGKHLAPFRVGIDAARHKISSGDARRLLRTDRHLATRLAYRDVAGATNRTTLIAALLPGGCVSTHTVYCLRTPLAMRAQWFLCALFNSFVVNYLVRLRVTTHVTTAIVEQLPIPTRDTAPGAFNEIAAFGRLLGRRADAGASASLNARVAELYQLSVAEFEHILETFPLIPLAERQATRRVFASASRR